MYNINPLLKKLIDSKQVISFDIFDTLLFRPYKNPTDLFRLIENNENCPGFVKARCSAESIFYSSSKEKQEANIDDIYIAIPNYSKFKDIELSLELNGLKANPYMKTIFEYALSKNKTVIIASDMYLKQDFLEQVLLKNNYNGYSKLYVSNTINARKDTGTMFDYILKDLNIKPSQMIHIGDNRHSDFKMPLKKHIAAYLYKYSNKQTLNHQKCIDKVYSPKENNLGYSIYTSIINQKEITDDYWYNFGYKYASSFVYGYCRWILETAKKNNLSKILFIARDGYIAKKVFDSFNSEIESEYVYAPRVYNYTCNLDYDHNQDHQAEVICKYFNKSFEKSKANEYIQNNYETFVQLAKTEKEKTGYSEYIKEIIGNNKSVGVIDTISGQLTGQSIIEKESGIKTFGFYVMAMNGQEITKKLENHSYYEDFLKRIFYIDNKPHLTELIFSSPENPIITLNNKKVVYNNKISENEKIRQETFKRIETGVLDFVNDASTRCGNYDIHLSNITVLDILNNYIYNPTKKDRLEMNKLSISPMADNSVYQPLFSADVPFYKVKYTKHLLWKTPLQKIFAVIFAPKSLLSSLKSKIKLMMYKRYKINSF